MSSLQIPLPEVLEREVGDRVEGLWVGEGGFKMCKLEVLRGSQSTKAGEGSTGVKHAFVFKESLSVAVCGRGSTEVMSAGQPSVHEICGKTGMTQRRLG